MSVTDGLLGPILGGVLAFVGAIVAAVLSFVLSRRNRTRRFDEEYARGFLNGGTNAPVKHRDNLSVTLKVMTDSPSHELVRMPNLNGFNIHQGAIGGVNNLHHGSRRLVEYWRSLEVNDI
ncbi:hypothetical protein NPX13_g471 [Xylaria arbuscula]|uniref:Uncharacterized protein n=1 Tax=Xylaria arbuscula TaxID=114810 RepID=A0A9W8NPC9_9PEZI|nr:hypothetical protein NPX13_g471 [Xylaria arbuscula]